MVFVVLSGILVDFSVVRVEAASRPLLPEGVRLVQLGERMNFEPVLPDSLFIRGSVPTEVPNQVEQGEFSGRTHRTNRKLLAAKKQPPKKQPPPKKPPPAKKTSGKKTPSGAPPPPRSMRRFALPPPPQNMRRLTLSPPLPAAPPRRVSSPPPPPAPRKYNR